MAKRMGVGNAQPKRQDVEVWEDGDRAEKETQRAGRYLTRQ